MPLVVLCGLPAAGKSHVAAALVAHLQQSSQAQVVHITDVTVNVDKLHGYDDGRTEKNTRSALKAAVEKSVNATDIVVLDALNYIKGVRYELFCKARAESTTYCVVYVDTPLEVALERNAAAVEQYDPKVIEDIASRFEVPIEKNRWDSPLFHLTPESIDQDGIPLDKITEAITLGKTIKAGLATKAAPAADSSFVQELDQITAAIVDAMLAYQRDGSVADGLVVPQSSTTLKITRKLSTAEIRRHRRQFIKIAQLRPCAVATIGNLFVDYLNEQV